ncbi:MAG: glutaminyl-peptide cyclotransferase [Candidatus Delongbacteria bacterium]|jgi:DNA-binding beta-propeller fold protein YncE|nr:glutaminyl-peptide cyclotransferase [Candidatus Delongbacteria bacterium]
MKKSNKHIAFILMALLVFSTACMEDDMQPVTAFDTSGDGVFIACEGNFMYGNASLSYYDKSTGNLHNQIFLKANGIPLGDVAQSLLIHDSNLWISLNNSGKIYAIDPQTFRHKGIIKELVSPRYMLPISDDEIWVSDLYAGVIHVINTKSYKTTGEISLNTGGQIIHNAEQMLRYNNTVITNCWSSDNTILFIDINEKKVTDSIKVRYQPKKIRLDKEGKMWVLSDGQYNSDGEKPALQRINPEDKTVETSIVFKSGDMPANIRLNSEGDSLYIINNDIYKMGIEDQQTGAPIIEGTNHNYYNLTEIPSDGFLYVTDAKNYLDPGMLYIFNQNYSAIDSLETGIIPSYIEH